VTNLLLLPGAVLRCAGIPRALLGHQVAVVGLRPAFPDFTPYEYRNLAKRCWIQEPEKRWGWTPGCPAPAQQQDFQPVTVFAATATCFCFSMDAVYSPVLSDTLPSAGTGMVDDAPHVEHWCAA
jgi:hypothetical protein